MPHPVTAYLDDIRASLGVGVPETSGHPGLRDLLHAVGDSLKPKISPVIHPANSGGGIRDGDLYSAKAMK